MTPPAAAAAAAPAVQPRRPLAPGRPYAPRPRRVSGPARRPADERTAHRRSPQHPGIAVGVIEALRRVSTHPMLDRLIRGRSWIALVAFALIGIVTLQLGLLKLNAGIGHALQREASLQRENAALSIENSELAAGDVVESSASRLGMEVVQAGALRFLTTRPGSDARHAAAALTTPVAGESPATSAPEASTSQVSASGSSSTSTESRSGESQASATSSGSEPQEAKPSPSESSAPQASAEPPVERSTPSPAAAATPSATTPSSTVGGSTEPSGGTQAGSTGR
ncbi:MAG TPA: hypothetical protein VNZ01_00405 [Solirubrobacteraceae bacterium]|nr:hypothetical protein [Solirubrobacteraceae bacterium]